MRQSTMSSSRRRTPIGLPSLRSGAYATTCQSFSRTGSLSISFPFIEHVLQRVRLFPLTNTRQHLASSNLILTDFCNNLPFLTALQPPHSISAVLSHTADDEYY